MEKLFIPYSLAVIAKEKGFPNNTGSCLLACYRWIEWYNKTVPKKLK
jgi:hypothetical protein